MSELLEKMNQSEPELQGVQFGTREEYAIEYLEYALQEYTKLMELEPDKVLRGRGYLMFLLVSAYTLFVSGATTKERQLDDNLETQLCFEQQPPNRAARLDALEHLEVTGQFRVHVMERVN